MVSGRPSEPAVSKNPLTSGMKETTRMLFVGLNDGNSHIVLFYFIFTNELRAFHAIYLLSHGSLASRGKEGDFLTCVQNLLSGLPGVLDLQSTEVTYSILSLAFLPFS